MDALTFDFPVQVGDVTIDQRWGGFCPGTVGSVGTVTDSLIEGWGALNIDEFGMVTNTTTSSGPLVDAGYDVAADAFLFGQLEFEVVGESGGCVQLEIGPASAGIVDNILDLLQPTFGSATVFVGSPILLGDVNGDDSVSLLDVAPFVDLIASGPFNAEADTNCDGSINLLDIAPFVAILSGSPLPVVDPTSDREPQFGQLGDVNDDGLINLVDLSVILHFPNGTPFPPSADINQDGQVDLKDLCPLIDLILSAD